MVSLCRGTLTWGVKSVLNRSTNQGFRNIVLSKRYFNDDQKTTMSILNEDQEAGLLINSFSKAGFRLNNGMMAVGPIAIFPKSVLSWNVSSAEDITEDSLSLFYTLEPKIDILVVGVGDDSMKVSPKVIQFMRQKKINLEILPTERACATFNFLNAEGRCVAGAIIPPAVIRVSEDDIAATQRKNKDFMKTEDDYLF